MTALIKKFYNDFKGYSIINGILLKQVHHYLIENYVETYLFTYDFVTNNFSIQ